MGRNEVPNSRTHAAARPPTRAFRSLLRTNVASGRERFSIISDGLPSQLPDIDPAETGEWIDSLDAVVNEQGRQRARYLMLRRSEEHTSELRHDQISYAVF